MPIDSPTAVATGALESTVTVGGHDLRLLRGGTTAGRPLLYLHGVGDLGGWSPALDLLAADRPVLRPDHPGFNGSRPDAALTTVRDLAGRHLELLDALGVDEVDLVGTSLGGWVATELALAAPTRVHRLVLVDAVGIAPDTAVPDLFDLAPDQLLELTSGPGPALDAGRARDAAVRADPVLSARRRSNTDAARRLAGPSPLHDPGLPDRLSDLRTPTLVLWGAHDGLVPVSLGQRWTQLLPDAELTVLEGAGHVPPLDVPEQFAALVGAFVDRPTAVPPAVPPAVPQSLP